MNEDILNDFEDIGLFENEPATPVAEVLGFAKRVSNNPLSSFINTVIPKAPILEISDDELNRMAQLETDYSLILLQIYLGIGTATVGFLAFTKSDQQKLDLIIENPSNYTNAEKDKLRELSQLAEKCRNHKFDNINDLKKFIFLAHQEEMKRMRTEGKLKIKTVQQYLIQIATTQMAKLTSDIPNLLPTLINKAFDLIKK